MLIILSHRTIICQSVSEVQLTGMAPLRTVSYRYDDDDEDDDYENYYDDDDDDDDDCDGDDY